jgi:hypothetical protein
MRLNNRFVRSVALTIEIKDLRFDLLYTMVVNVYEYYIDDVYLIQLNDRQDHKKMKKIFLNI